jgi:hypothetical protein
MRITFTQRRSYAVEIRLLPSSSLPKSICSRRLFSPFTARQYTNLTAGDAIQHTNMTEDETGSLISTIDTCLISVSLIILTQELFYELMELKLNAGTPTHAWWKTKVDSRLKLDSENREFRKSWMALSGRLTSYLSEFQTLIEYPGSLFGCCKHPEIVCADGDH